MGQLATIVTILYHALVIFKVSVQPKRVFIDNEVSL